MNKLVSTLVATLALTLSPALAYAGGTPNGVACMGDVDCTSGHCADGVCCDTACAGQCEACSVAGSLGLCTPVVGAPHGTRAACSDGAGNACAAAACDGVSRTSCAGFKNGATVVCAAASCTDGKATGEARCDGAGHCPAPTAISCAPYACAGGLCKATCASNADCQTGSVCDGASGKCFAVSTCSADGTSSIAPNGQTQSCAPYRCGTDGTCHSVCLTDADCSSPNVCDKPTERCKDPNDQGLAAPGQSTSSGCALAGAGGGVEASAFALAFGALVGLGVARRRRARVGRNG